MRKLLGLLVVLAACSGSPTESTGRPQYETSALPAYQIVTMPSGKQYLVTADSTVYRLTEVTDTAVERRVIEHAVGYCADCTVN